MINENSHLYWSKSLFWGLEIGVDIVLYCIVAQWWWDRPFGVSGFVPYMIIAICIFQCHRELGKLDANITFAELLLAGVCSGASGSLIVDLYAAIYVKAYDPSFMEQMVEQSVVCRRRYGGGGAQCVRAGADGLDDIGVCVCVVDNVGFRRVFN